MILLLKNFQQQHPAIRRLSLRLAFEALTGPSHQLDLVHILEAEDLIEHRPLKAIVDWPCKVKVFKTKHHVVLSV